jgi:conjugal transfer pilus assembly protein TrbC
VLARIDRRACWALACLLPCVALAQTPQWPTAQDIDRALKANPFPDADRIGAQPIPKPPRVDPQRSAIDIEALARGKVHLPNAGTTSGAATVPLRIFITLDMPRASLQLLTDQAARAGAVLVLRGLKAQSMRQTVAVGQELIGKRRVSWVIDPDAFTRFAGQRRADVRADAGRRALSCRTIGRCPSCPDAAKPGCATPASFLSVWPVMSAWTTRWTMLRRQPRSGTACRAPPQTLRKASPAS